MLSSGCGYKIGEPFNEATVQTNGTSISNIFYSESKFEIKDSVSSLFNQQFDQYPETDNSSTREKSVDKSDTGMDSSDGWIDARAEARYLRCALQNGKKPTHYRRNSVNKETTAEYWNNVAQNILQKATSKKPITNVAKNVILFLGDGMSVPTVTAARIYAGGESSQLSFENFPYTAVSKTYCVDRLVPESTCTATAYLGGVKGNFYTSGLTAAVKWKDCEGSLLPENQVPSIAVWFQKEEKWTGLVTNTRLTHSSPAGLYSHTANKLWESDTEVLKTNRSTEQCPDIAQQLIHSEVGQDFHVMLGCGRRHFIPKELTDEEGTLGYRSDSKNLIEEWKILKNKDQKKHEYVWNRRQLLDVKNDTDYLFGLFEEDMCRYNVDRDPEMDPTLEEMTEAAIKRLNRSPNGYFLFIEGGMIDQAHHINQAGKSLDETREFSRAISKALEMTNEQDTLIVVTADHSHTMHIGGYPKRGSDILGLTNFSDVYPIKEVIPILSYANGLGVKDGINGLEHNFTADKIDMEYTYPVLFKLPQETHGGDDVIIYAKGPWAHLFQGVMEQNAIPHFMAYAACVGSGNTACKDGAVLPSSSSGIVMTNFSPIYNTCAVLVIFSLNLVANLLS